MGTDPRVIKFVVVGGFVLLLVVLSRMANKPNQPLRQ